MWGLCSLLGAMACQPPADSASQTESPPNIIIFYADDMGYGDLGCYGSPNIRTPHIDRLAASGIRLTSFYSVGPVCTPSRAGLLTGRYPIRNIPGNVGPGSSNGLPTDEITLAQVLKQVGYATYAVGKWHLGHLPEFLPTQRGFDEFFGLPYSNDMIRPWVQTDSSLYLYRNAQRWKVVDYDQDSLTHLYTAEAIRMIRESGDKPFFLYLPYSMPHLPISTVEAMRGSSAGGLYGDVIETIDWSVGEVLGAVAELGKSPSTLVVFSSDNGPWHDLPERMLQRGVQPWYQGSAGPLRAAKATTYDGGMRVPGILSWPGNIPAGQVSSEIACTMDLFTTVAHIAGASLPEDRPIDGLDLRGFLTGEQAASPREELFFFRGKYLEAVRQGDWKYRLSPHARPEVNPETDWLPELYELSHDPGERYNRYESETAQSQALHTRLVDFARETAAETWK